MQRLARTVLQWLVPAVLAGCTGVDPMSPTPVDTGAVNFSRYIAVGNSLTAGSQSNSTSERFQQFSFPALLAAAARAPEFVQPLISEPGIPPRIVVTQIVPTLVVDTLLGVGSPINSTYPKIFNNLGIFGAKAHDLLVTRPDAGSVLFQIVLRDTAFGATAIDQAVNAQPTFATLWTGSVDIYSSASVGTDLLMTDVASFEADYRALLDKLRAASDAVVTANLPDILPIPFFATIPPILVDPFTGEPILDPSGNVIPLIGEFQGTAGALPPGTLVTLLAFPLLAEGIGIPSAAGGTGQPLPDAVVVDVTELAKICQRIQDFNVVIDSVATNRNVPVVDIHALFDKVDSEGVDVHGQEITTEFLTGGLFSVDGFHPSSVGYWVIAREFIRVINARFGSAIPEPPLPIEPNFVKTTTNLVSN